jgi:hypothetical protein
MMNKLYTWLGGLFLISILPLLYFTTNIAGKKAFVDLAVEYEICIDAASCSEAEKSILAQLILEKTNYSGMRQIEWCLGVDTWADATVRRGGWLIGPMMDVGYWFCPISS